MVLVELRGMEGRVISGVWKCDQIYLHGHRDYIELNVSDCFRWHFVGLVEIRASLSSAIYQTRALGNLQHRTNVCNFTFVNRRSFS